MKGNMMKITTPVKITMMLAAAIAVVLGVFQNCSDVHFDSAATPSSSATGGPVNPPLVDPPPPVEVTKSLTLSAASDYVCSPFGTLTIPSAQSGVRAELRYMDPTANLTTTQKNSVLAVDYFDDSNPVMIKAPQTLFLPDINVPTRQFTSGFSTTSGSSIKDNQNQLLTEYFALKMETVLKLGPNDPEGDYELATLSDDGTVLQIKQGIDWSTLISNDGPHSTRMVCAPQVIHFTKSTLLPVRLYYNQGPRTEIASVLAWNFRGSVGATGNVINETDMRAYCDLSSSTKFWNPTTMAPAEWAVDVFNNKGWHILTPLNFQLPDNEVNPCAYSSYDEIKQLIHDLKRDGSVHIQFLLKDASSTVANLYLLDQNMQQTLAFTQSFMNSSQGEFDLPALTPQKTYRLEFIMSVPGKSLNVRKVYSIQTQ